MRCGERSPQRAANYGVTEEPMNDLSRSFVRRGRLWLAGALVLGMLAGGCWRSRPAAPDPDALKKEGEELKEQFRREMKKR
jgi:hypothetical protein